MRRTRGADPSSPALREASLRAEPTGLPCAKRACERSPRACPARSEPASGAHGFLLRMTRNSSQEAFGSWLRGRDGRGPLQRGDNADRGDRGTGEHRSVESDHEPLLELGELIRRNRLSPRAGLQRAVAGVTWAIRTPLQVIRLPCAG